MSSSSLWYTKFERWNKIVKAADSGRYPNIIIQNGEIVTTPKAGDAAEIQSFLADVFKEGDNEWFKTGLDTLEANNEKPANEGQPESSKKKTTSLTEQDTLARLEKIDRELRTARVLFLKGAYTPAEWKAITVAVKDLDGSTAVAKALGFSGVKLEGITLVATGHSVAEAHSQLDRFVMFALERDYHRDSEVQ